MTNKKEGLRLLSKLINENNSGTPIIVEGITDKEALRRLGCKGEIFITQGSGYSLYNLAEKVSDQSKKAIIFTDPDHAGSEIAGKLAGMLERNGVHPDLRYRRISSLLGFSQVAHIKIDTTLFEELGKGE